MLPEHERRIPVTPSARVIVDNDFAADPDGLVALTHHLLAEAAIIRGVTCTSIPFIAQDLPSGDPARRIAAELIERLRLPQPPPVSADASVRFAELSETTAGARLILDEAARTDDLPLVVSCGGPLTNVASALREDPGLASRVTLVWIGGGAYPEGGWEFNLTHDLPAARFVFNESRVPITQVPLPAYRQCAMSVAELEVGLAAAGEFGRWLYSGFTQPPEWAKIGGAWPMGDSPPVLITALTNESSTWRTIETPWIEEDGGYGRHLEPRDLVLYDTVDTRLLFADFFARMQLAAARLGTSSEAGDHDD